MGNARFVGGGDALTTQPMLRVNEIFTSVQGEGPSAGEPAVFLRLASCNLNCVWCDTPYSWDWHAFDRSKEVHSMTIDDVLRMVLACLGECKLLVITGGEPLLQQAGLAVFLQALRTVSSNVRAEVETNGTIQAQAEVASLVHLFVASPKLANSAIAGNRRLRPHVLQSFARLNSVLKFVTVEPSEAEEVGHIVANAGFEHDRVWLMPEGTTAQSIREGMKELAPVCVANGYNLSPRLHILMWGDVRGL